eukprot:scaffold4936_cov73-Phaeocystis_antarctica.AAC.1
MRPKRQNALKSRAVDGLLQKLVPQFRAQVRPHLPGEGGTRGVHAERRSRCARRASVGEVAAAVEAVFEGAPKASTLPSRAWRTVAGVAHRGRLLKLDLDATAGGVFDGLLGLVVELVELQAATGRPRGSDVGAGARATRPPKGRRGLGAHAAHDKGSIA